MFINLLINLFIIVYGFVLPLYWSHQALEQENTKEINKWLTHWIVYILFHQALNVFSAIFSSWLPFYNAIVFLGFLWLLYPQFNGGKLIYKHYLRPFLAKHGHLIDSSIKSVGKQTLQFGMAASLKCLELLRVLLIWFLKKYGTELSDFCGHVSSFLTPEKALSEGRADFKGRQSEIDIFAEGDSIMERNDLVTELTTEKPSSEEVSADIRGKHNEVDIFSEDEDNLEQNDINDIVAKQLRQNLKFDDGDKQLVIQNEGIKMEVNDRISKNKAFLKRNGDTILAKTSKLNKKSCVKKDVHRSLLTGK